MTRLSIFFAILIFLCECNSGRADAEDDAVETIRRQYADWLIAYQKKDLSRTMEIFAPDVISTFAGATDSDLAAVRRSYEKSFAGGRPPRQWKPVDLEVIGSGDLAYALSDWQLLEEDSNGAVSVLQTNRSIDVLKGDGKKWKIIRSFTIPQDGREVKL